MFTIDKKFGKYANPEVERKFLLRGVPSSATFHSEITDLYVKDSTLRLRKAETKGGTRYKLAQKIRPNPQDTRMILHTNIYLSESEYDLVTSLPSNKLQKTRHSFKAGNVPVGVDQFHGALDGLVVLEVDFGANGNPDGFASPSIALAEVTDDERFTGATLATTTRATLIEVLDEVADLKLPPSDK